MTALAAVPVPLPGGPIGAPRRASRRYASRPESRSRDARTVWFFTRPCLGRRIRLVAASRALARRHLLRFRGRPFCGGGGFEFLFGYLYADEDGTATYVGDWVTTRQEERAAFERFVDFVTARLRSIRTCTSTISRPMSRRR